MSSYLYLVPRNGSLPIETERLEEAARKELMGKVLNNISAPLRFEKTQTHGELCLECFVSNASCLALMAIPKKRAAMQTVLKSVTRVLLRDYAEVEVVYCADDGAPNLPRHDSTTDVDEFWNSIDFKEYHRTNIRRAH